VRAGAGAWEREPGAGVGAGAWSGSASLEPGAGGASWLMERGQVVVGAGGTDGYLCNFEKSVAISANDANSMAIFGVFPT
jgi:hypothetical protein